MEDSQYSADLDKNAANYTPLSPLTFIERAAAVYPERCALVYNQSRRSWRETYRRSCRFASALRQNGVTNDDTVAVMLPNVPAMYEAHFAIPMAGAIIHALNIRLDPDAIAFQLEHGGARVLLTDTEYSATVAAALDKLDDRPLVIDVDDPAFKDGKRIGDFEYEDVTGERRSRLRLGVAAGRMAGDCAGLYLGHHRQPQGRRHPSSRCVSERSFERTRLEHQRSPGVSLDLPMFHCNGWCFPWTIAALNGTSVCLREVRDTAIFDAIRKNGVTHLCGAPVVLNLMANADDELKKAVDRPISVMTAGAAPPPAVLEAMARLNFNVTHTYGLTEVYGPAVVCSWHEDWDRLPMREQSQLKARQGVRYPMLEELVVADPETLEPVPKDGKTIGEIMFRGNIVMKGYLKNPEATARAFAGGYFHSGDLAVCHPDGYIEIKDRAKDVIISGGENISSIEVEAILYSHPAVLEAAVTAMPDEKWGETPCAFVNLRSDAGAIGEQELINFCRENMAHFKAPRKVVFGPLPKTSTGKIRKFELRKKAGLL